MSRSHCFLTCFALGVLLTGCTEKNTHITQVIGPEDWQPPLIEWNYQPDAEVRGMIGIDVAIEDSSEVVWARLYLDGLPSIELQSAPYRFEFDTDTLADGVHVLETRAQDAFGNLGVSPILRLNVVNTAPEGPRLLWVPDSFATIQAAINASQDYDTIRVRDGTYYETLNTFGKGIWIESENGSLATTVQTQYSHVGVFFSPCQTRTTLRGFTLTSAYILLVFADGAFVDLLNNLLIADYPPDSSNYLLITGFVGGQVANNLFSGSRTAVQLGGFLGSFENNIIQHAWNVGLWNTTRENTIFHGYNAFWQNGQNYAGFSQEEGEFDANPLIDLTNGLLLPGSPCIDSGNPDIFDNDGSRSDIGPFGGPWAY